MGLHTTDDKEYTKLMAHHGKGNFLYVPETYKRLHPGSIGYWDEGQWVEVTDLSVPGRPEADGFGPAPPQPMDDAQDQIWKTMSSESGSETGGRLKAEGSGLMAGGPLDAGIKAENKNTADKKAAIITDEVVKRERFVTRNNVFIAQWVKENAKKLVNSAWGDKISKLGLHAVHTTYVTSQCAITMTTDKSRNMDLGLDLGATGIAKLGAGGTSLQKLKGEGWTTHESKEGDKGLVVCYTAAEFKLARFSRWRTHALSQVKAEGAAEVRAILDENGNVTGYEEVPAPKAEPNDVQEVEEEVVTFDIESMGLSDEVLEEERKAAEEKQEATKREQDEFRKKFDEIQKLPEEERKAAQMKLLEESSTTVVEKPIPLPTTEEIVTIIPRA